MATKSDSLLYNTYIRYYKKQLPYKHQRICSRVGKHMIGMKQPLEKILHASNFVHWEHLTIASYGQKTALTTIYPATKNKQKYGSNFTVVLR